MKQNDSGHPDLDQFDSAIPDTATQSLEATHDDHTTLQPYDNFTKLLFDHDYLTNEHALTVTTLTLELQNAPTEDDRYTNEFCDSAVVAKAMALHSQHDNIAAIGSMWVQHRFRNCGIATRLKHQLHNHIDQLNIDTTLTLLLSDSGRALAAKTGYEPTILYFPYNRNIWARTQHRD